MGNVDTVRKVLGLHKVKRGSNTGPGSLQWYQLFNYIMYNVWRLYSLNAIHKSKIDKINTWTQFRNCKKKFCHFIVSLIYSVEEIVLDTIPLRNIIQILTKISIDLTFHQIRLLRPELAMCKQWIQTVHIVFQ